MSKETRKLSLSNIEIYVLRIASLILLLLTILKILKVEMVRLWAQ
jgi:hypothetical protein